MARGDPTYCQVDVEIFPNGERFSSLSANQGFLYLALWALAVKCRSETIPADISTAKWVSEWTHKERKSVQRWMDKLTKIHLITRNADGSLTVHTVKSRHKKLRWDKCPEMVKGGQLQSPSNRPEKGGESERREIETPESGVCTCTSGAELVTQRRTEPASPQTIHPQSRAGVGNPSPECPDAPSPNGCISHPPDPAESRIELTPEQIESLETLNQHIQERRRDLAGEGAESVATILARQKRTEREARKNKL